MTLVQEIGAYAGFAAVVGLAVLAALYFSQARDVKRLREWAGRAPERAAEQEARIRAATPAAQAQPAQQRTAVAAQGGAPAVAPPPAGGPTAVQSPQQSRPSLPTATPGGGFRPGPGQGPILGGARPDDPWYRRIQWPEPKYLALIVAGILILGGGAAYGVSQLTGGKSSNTPAASSPGGGKTGAAKPKGKHGAGAVDPSKIRVSVLNGTTVTGQASKLADQIESKGYQRGTVANAGTQGQRAESVVEYSDGNSAAARAVGRELGITQVEKVDPATQQLAGDAAVIVILGADKAAATG